MHRMQYTLPLFCAMLSFAGIASASPIPLNNGNFGTGDLSGWTLGGLNDGYLTVDYAPNGPYAAEFGAVGGDDTLSQSFTDTPGDTVILTFDFATDGTTPNDFSAWANDSLLFAETNLADQNFNSYSFAFLATGNDSILFAGRNDNGYNYLENVQVNDIGPTPEPSSLVLLGTGLLGTVGMVRRRQKSTLKAG